MSKPAGRIGTAPTPSPDEVLVYLRRAAAARGVSLDGLTAMIMSAITEDRIVDAILDDGVTTPKV
jgi:hypothetical protein